MYVLPLFMLYASLGVYFVLMLAMSFSVGVSCGHPGIPSNGCMDTSAGTSFGDVARYSCDAGYTLNEAAERTCQADGQWNGTEPTCESEILESSNQLVLCLLLFTCWDYPCMHTN